MAQERRICVRGIIIKDGKIFAQRLKKNVGSVNEYWCTPGGGLDPNESLHEGLHREMIEETGVAPKIGNLLLVQQFDDDGREQMEFFFHIQNADDYQDVNLADTTHGEIEIEHFGFIDPKTENILPKDLQKLDLVARAASVQPVHVINELVKT